MFSVPNLIPGKSESDRAGIVKKQVEEELKRLEDEMDACKYCSSLNDTQVDTQPVVALTKLHFVEAKSPPLPTLFPVTFLACSQTWLS